jgi:hypothetical protein
MLGNHCRDLGDLIFQKFSTKLANLGAKTWMMNIFAIISILGSFYFFISYNILHIYNIRNPHYYGLIMLFFNHLFDYFDSGLDRARRFLHKKPFRYRKLFHITTDKLSETIFFSGLALGGYVPWRNSIYAISTCILITLVGIWVKHKRVFDLDRSLFDRADRFFVIFICVWSGYNIFGIVLVSLMNIVGIIQRLIALFIAKRPKLI